jgi:hypothetical protein
MRNRIIEAGGDPKVMSRIFGFAWRMAASAGVVVVACVALMLIARLAGYSPDWRTLLSYVVAGAVVFIAVWSLVSVWTPFLRVRESKAL